MNDRKIPCKEIIRTSLSKQNGLLKLVLAVQYVQNENIYNKDIKFLNRYKQMLYYHKAYDKLIILLKEIDTDLYILEIKCLEKMMEKIL